MRKRDSGTTHRTKSHSPERAFHLSHTGLNPKWLKQRHAFADEPHDDPKDRRAGEDTHGESHIHEQHEADIHFHDPSISELLRQARQTGKAAPDEAEVSRFIAKVKKYRTRQIQRERQERGQENQYTHPESAVGRQIQHELSPLLPRSRGRVGAEARRPKDARQARAFKAKQSQDLKRELDRLQRQVPQAFKQKDPITGKEIQLVPQARVEALTKILAIARTAEDPNIATKYRKRARNLIAQTSQHAQRHITARRELLHAAQSQAALEAYPDAPEDRVTGHVEREPLTKKVEHTTLEKLRSIPGQKRLGSIRDKTPDSLLPDVISHPEHPMSIEESYRISGHEKMGGFEGIKRHAKFNARPIRHQLAAIKEGTFTSGYNTKGVRVKPENASILLSPNLKWRYKVNENPATARKEDEELPEIKGGRRVKLPKTNLKDVEYWNTNVDEIHRAERNRSGDIIPGDWEEMVHERLVPKQQTRTQVKLGQRVAKGITKPNHVEKDIIVPVKGLKTRSTKVFRAAGKEETEVTEAVIPAHRVRTAGSGWESVGDTRRIPVDELPADLRQQGLRVETVRRKKDIRVHYVPAEDTSLEGKEKDSLSIRAGKKRLIGLNISQGTDRDKLLNHLLFEPKRVQEEHAKRAISEHAHNTGMSYEGARADLINRTLPKGSYIAKAPEGHMTSAVLAGAATLKLVANKRFREGYAPAGANKVISALRSGHPRVDRYLTEHNVPHFAVKEAYVRPVAEKAANFKFQLRHPLSDPEGTAMGVDWGRWRYRDFWINNDTKMARKVERRSNEISRVLNTQKYFEKNAYSSNPITKFFVGRKDNALRHKDYKNFYSRGGLLDKTVDELTAMRAHVKSGGHAEKAIDQAIARNRTLLKAHNVTAEGPLRRGPLPVSRETQDRIRNWKGSLALDAPQGKRFATEVSLGGRGEPQRVLVNAGLNTRIERFVASNRAPLAVVGTAALALGAHYGYHKWKQSKLPPEERTAYYNKILPPAFHVPVPSVRRTGYVRIPSNVVTREFHSDNKKVPVKLGLSVHQKKITFRPMDRGYPKNAKIFGDLKFGTGKPTGSIKDSVFQNSEAIYNRKRSFTSKQQGLKIAGHETPFYVTIGNQRKVKLTASNPHKLTNEDRENTVWTFAGTPDEERVKNFYKADERMQEMFTDTKEISRLRRQKGSSEAKAFANAIEAAKKGRVRVGVTLREPDEESEPRRNIEQDLWDQKRKEFERRGIEWR